MAVFMRTARTLGLACACAATMVHAQPKTERPNGYPNKPVRMLVGNAPGGGIDLTARAVAQRMTDRWGRSFIVDNRPGGTGLIAIELTANATPDGYTLLVTSGSLVSSATVLKRLPHDPRKTLAPVTQLLAGDYSSIAMLALDERRATGWPPFSHLALFRAEDRNRSRAFDLLGRLKRHCGADTAEARFMWRLVEGARLRLLEFSRGLSGDGAATLRGVPVRLVCPSHRGVRTKLRIAHRGPAAAKNASVSRNCSTL